MLRYDAKSYCEKWQKEDDTFLENELIQAEKTALKVDYPTKKFANGSILPISTELPEGTEYYKYKIFDILGYAKYIANPADDLPRVGIDVKEVMGKIYNSGNEFAWTFKDIRAARLARRSLDSELLISAKDAHMNLFNVTIPFGNVTYNILGLFNNPNVTEYAVSTVGSGTPNTLWLENGIATKTPDQIIADICGILNSIITVSKETQEPNRLLLPLTHMQHISCTARATNSDTTILEFVQGIFPNVQFIGLSELQQATLTAYGILGPSGGALTGSMMVAMNVNERNVKVHMPMPFKKQPSYQLGLSIMSPCEMETGGTDIRKPLGFAYGKNI